MPDEACDGGFLVLARMDDLEGKKIGISKSLNTHKNDCGVGAAVPSMGPNPAAGPRRRP